MSTYYIIPTGSLGGTPENPIVLPPGVPGVPGHLPAPIPGAPSHPIVLPPLPGVWPKPGEPSQPIVIPPDIPGVPSHPIVIPSDPQHPIALPPGTVWPPLPPSVAGKHAILIWVVGVGSRWLIVDAPPTTLPLPPVAQPK